MDDVAKGYEKRGLPGWNFLRHFCSLECLSEWYVALGMRNLALQQYRDVDRIFHQLDGAHQKKFFLWQNIVKKAHFMLIFCVLFTHFLLTFCVLLNRRCVSFE